MKVHDLEDKIMNVWGTVEDIDTFLYRYLDSPAGEMSEDDIANTLLGIKTLHDQRCQKLWDAFGEVLKSNRDHRHGRQLSTPTPAEKITCKGTAAISSPIADASVTRNPSTTATGSSDRMQFPSHLQADREPLESGV